MPVRWQTYDKLFDMPKTKGNAAAGKSRKAELALTPRPGEPMRWCAHDKQLVYQLTRAAVFGTLSQRAKDFLVDLSEAPTVTLEQVGWLRGLARRVSFAETNAVNGGRRAMDLDGSVTTPPPSSKG